MQNFRILVAYDGSKFFGWQRQDGFLSVQQALEEALLALTGRTVIVFGAGRTDTGVHALGQVASFHIDTHLSADRLRHALNATVASGITVRRAEACPDDFHARFSARSKRYLYSIATTRFQPAFGRDHVHWMRYPLDLARMRAAARELVGTHDFKAFGNTGSPRKSTVRTIHGLHFIARRERLAIVVQADGFLYNMVRTIAGTLLDVGRGKRPVACVRTALASGVRADAGITAPPSGLYLVSVQYDEPILRPCEPGPFGPPGVFRL